MSRDLAPLTPHPYRVRSSALVRTVLATLAVAVGLIAMHAGSGAMPGPAMDSVAMDSTVTNPTAMGPAAAAEDDAPRVTFALSSGSLESRSGGNPTASECTAERDCRMAMSSMACPVAPAPTHSLKAPPESPLRSLVTISTNSTTNTSPHAVPAQAPDLTQLSVSRI